MGEYPSDDTTDMFMVSSTIGYPDMSQADPLGGFQGVPDAAFGGYGTGAETLNADGSVETRYKNPMSGVNGNNGFDGGAA